MTIEEIPKTQKVVTVHKDTVKLTTANVPTPDKDEILIRNVSQSSALPVASSRSLHCRITMTTIFFNLEFI